MKLSDFFSIILGVTLIAVVISSILYEHSEISNDSYRNVLNAYNNLPESKCIVMIVIRHSLEM